MIIKEKNKGVFKEGDRIYCIDNKSATHFLTLGKLYTVVSISRNINTIYIINDVGQMDWFNIKRFKPYIALNRNKVINDILE